MEVKQDTDITVNITYKCRIPLDKDFLPENLEEIVDRTSVHLCIEHGGNCIDQNIVDINTCPDGCPNCDYWKAFFADTTEKRYCPHCSSIIDTIKATRHD